MYLCLKIINLNKKIMFKQRFSFFLLLLFIGVNSFSQDSIAIKSIRKTVEVLASDSFEGRGFRCNSKALSIDFLKREFAAAGFEPLKGSYEQKFMNFETLTATEGTNIVGLIQGSDSVLKNEYIVIGAHYDHLGWKMTDTCKVVYNGADDNASGVATMIETGKLLLADRSLLKRSVLLIAFDGEEAGLVGSEEFIAKNLIDTARMKVMFSLDMVGMYSTNGGLNIAGMNSLQGGTELFGKSLSRTALQIKKTTNSIEKRTDTRSFGDVDIPAIHFTTGSSSPYHKPEDDANLLDYKGMADLSSLLVDFTVALSNEDALLAGDILKSDLPDKKKGGSAFMVGYNLGVGSNYHYYKERFFDGKALFSFEGGLNSQLRLSKSFILQADVNYEFLGGETVYGSTRMHSVVPALNLMITTNNKSKQGFFAFASAGAYYRYNFAGSTGDDHVALFDAYNHDDYGVKYTLGFQVEKIQFNFNGLVGLSNIDMLKPYGNVYNRGSYFSLVKFF